MAISADMEIMEIRTKNAARILACHGNKTTLDQIGRSLCGAGMRTDCADDTGLAEALLTDNDYDAVLLDLFLADMDGISFANALNQAFPQLPVLVCSSWPDPAHPGMTATRPEWVDACTRHARLVLALKMMAGNAMSHRQQILCIGNRDDCPEDFGSHLARHASVFRVHNPYELEEAISTNNFDLVVYSPDRDAQTARDNYRILLDSLMPIPLVIHPGSGANCVIDLVRQVTEADIPLPRHAYLNTCDKPENPALFEMEEFQISKGIEQWESLNR